MTGIRELTELDDVARMALALRLVGSTDTDADRALLMREFRRPPESPARRAGFVALGLAAAALVLGAAGAVLWALWSFVDRHVDGTVGKIVLGTLLLGTLVVGNVAVARWPWSGRGNLHGRHADDRPADNPIPVSRLTTARSFTRRRSADPLVVLRRSQRWQVWFQVIGIRPMVIEQLPLVEFVAVNWVDDIHYRGIDAYYAVVWFLWLFQGGWISVVAMILLTVVVGGAAGKWVRLRGARAFLVKRTLDDLGR